MIFYHIFVCDLVVDCHKIARRYKKCLIFIRYISINRKRSIRHYLLLLHKLHKLWIFIWIEWYYNSFSIVFTFFSLYLVIVLFINLQYLKTCRLNLLIFLYIIFDDKYQFGYFLCCIWNYSVDYLIVYPVSPSGDGFIYLFSCIVCNLTSDLSCFEHVWLYNLIYCSWLLL